MLPVDAPAHPAPPRADPGSPPGGLLVWLVVLLEVLTFAAGFVVFAVQRRAAPELFAAGRASLDQALALANTLVLLGGGAAMAWAVERLQSGAARSARRWTLVAAGSAGVFVVLKCVEYAAKLDHGLGLQAGPFFTLYWLLTGFHLLHVVVAGVILAWIAFRLRPGSAGPPAPEDAESGAVFWHLCDLVWLLLYPLLYLWS